MNYAERDYWRVHHSAGVPFNTKRNGAGFAVDIPPIGVNNALSYIITKERHELVKSNRDREILVQCVVSQSADAEYDHMTESFNVPTPAANFRPMLMLSWSGREHDRWWPDTGITLAAGAHTLRIPFDAARWSSVYGKKANSSGAARSRFNDAIKDGAFLALTFGGGNFYGHGVRMTTGSASVRITRYSVV